jgi:hypothetical protein
MDKKLNVLSETKRDIWKEANVELKSRKEKRGLSAERD